MIQILKASAGSGKTFNLAKNYIYLLLRKRRDPEAHRHILALTFTNKATEEMKGRILEELHLLATDPSASHLAPYYLPGPECMSPEAPVCPDAETLRQAAGTCLSGILHDYGEFSVSTIDRFFQRALKAFSREAGHFTAYQVELDRKGLIEQSVARLLDGLAPEDAELLTYLRDGAMDALQYGRKMNLQRQLAEAALRLFGEEYREAAKGRAQRSDPAEIRSLVQQARGVERDFAGRVKDLARKYLALVEGAGLSAEDFASKGKSFVAALSKKYASLRPGAKIERPVKTLAESIADPEQWFAKSDKAGPAKRARLPEAEMQGLGEAFLQLFDSDFVAYRTAATLSAGLWNLGVAARLQGSYDALTREKNLLTLEDSNALLRGIIDGSDAPFVYERLGVRYEHFLLDEFQDTSRVQWDNMLPLLLESQSHEGRDGEAPYGLIVGDVKQSIYRWRGSDWSLMQEQAPRDLSRAGVALRHEALQENHRSLQRIIDFNNAFFRFLADRFDASLDRTEEAPVGRIYAEDTLCQRLPAYKAGGPGGCVEIEFLPAEAVFARVLERIDAWRADGVRLADMAILVRKNRHGAEVAEYLMGHDPSVRIVSDDSLRVRSSEVVRRLVASLHLQLGRNPAINAYLAGWPEDAGTPAPGRSLPDLCQQLLRREDPALLKAHTLFVDAFLDRVQEYVACNGNDLAGFLEAFEGSDPSIASPEGSDAVRIITVHKSKGLQFPYVIYLNIHSDRELAFLRGDRKWCLLETAHPALAALSGRVYDVDFQAKHEDDLFAAAQREELCLKYMDTINTYYVAFTRPKNGLCILSDGKAAGRNVAGELYRFADAPGSGFIRTEADGCTRFRFGEPVPAGERPPVPVAAFPMDFVSYPPGERLAFSPEAGDFFGEEGSVGVDASARRRGTAYHRILSAVERPAELEKAVEGERLLGNLDAAQATEALVFLRQAVAEGERMGLFPAGAEARVYNELPLMDADGRVLRPDRVVIEGERVRVVDYKFGAPRPAYARQLKQYVEAFRAMGYAQVEGWLWYVEKNEFVPETK